jgi:membrane protein DedA with SNARE-associated domain
MHDFIYRLIEGGGYWGIAVLMFLENVFPPIPSEVIMGLGGVGVARGTFQFWPLLLIGTLGATVGNYVWFLLGHRLGHERLTPFVTRWGRWLTVELEDIERGAALFRRHGAAIVFVLRFLPLLRTIISLPAGLARMGHLRFLAFTFAGTAVWNAALIHGGRLLAQQEAVLSIVVYALMALAVLGYAWRLVTWRPRAD